MDNTDDYTNEKKKIILNVKLFKLAEDMHWTIYTGKQQLYI